MKKHATHTRMPAPADPEWSPEDVPAIASRAGISELNDHHWKVIASCREETARCGHPPGLRRLEELTGFESGELQRLFPGEVATLVARIAGLTRRHPGTRGRTDDES